MNDNELIAFEIISNVGTAKSKFMEALVYAKKGEFKTAQETIEKGNTFLLEGHKVHSRLIQQEAAGEKTDITLLLMHAEDQFMSAETIKLLITEMIEMRQDFSR